MKKKTIKYLVIAILLLFVLFSVISFVLVNSMISGTFARAEDNEASGYLRYSDVEDSYSRELMSFYSGDNLLQGYLYGYGNENGLVVQAHGIGCCAEDYLAETLCFVDNGYAVFTYDNTGCGLSEGDSMVGLQQAVYDNDAALTFIESDTRFDNLPVLLYGHSWGAYAVTAGLNFSHDVAAVVSVSGFNKPVSMMIEWGRGTLGAFAYVEYPYVYIHQLTVFGSDVGLSAVDGINSTDTPVLIVHGTNDETVPGSSVGTIAYRDEITNPNVQYKLCDEEGHNGHSDLFLSESAVEYSRELTDEYERLQEQYGGDLPKSVRKEFYESIDRKLVSELDEDFMSDILTFFQVSTSHSV